MIVEDAYYLAMDAKRALEEAGARVLGPFRDDRAAMLCLDQETPDCVLLDVNLGDGPTFELAKVMQARSIPFVFFTGYDGSVIPAEFAPVTRLEKPVQKLRLVRVLEDQIQPA
jgi:two-component SAPR family response regulator